MKIIGLSGKSGSGKDYIATNILKARGYHVMSFAWPMKISVVAKGLATYEEVFITKPPHVRHLLQQEGTELGRNVYGVDYWVKSAYGWMRTINEQWGIDKFVITDVRFPNELDFVKDSGGSVFRILAPQRIAQTSLSTEARMHISETALDGLPLHKYDGFIWNELGSEATLEARIMSVFTILNID